MEHFYPDRRIVKFVTRGVGGGFEAGVWGVMGFEAGVWRVVGFKASARGVLRY